jgi:polo-like kinase 1
MKHPPDKLSKKISILKYFMSFLDVSMKSKQENDFKQVSNDQQAHKELEFLIKYMKTKHAMVFRMSNKLIQAINHLI